MIPFQEPPAEAPAAAAPEEEFTDAQSRDPPADTLLETQDQAFSEEDIVTLAKELAVPGPIWSGVDASGAKVRSRVKPDKMMDDNRRLMLIIIECGPSQKLQMPLSHCELHHWQQKLIIDKFKEWAMAIKDGTLQVTDLKAKRDEWSNTKGLPTTQSASMKARRRAASSDVPVEPERAGERVKAKIEGKGKEVKAAGVEQEGGQEWGPSQGRWGQGRRRRLHTQG